MTQLEALESHVALFGLFDDADMSAAIEAAIEKQETHEMSKARKEKTLRIELPDSAFGLPEKRKYPLTDHDRVLNAIKFFKFCPEEDRKELAANIEKAAKKFHIELKVIRGNPIAKYIDNVIVVSPKNAKK